MVLYGSRTKFAFLEPIDNVYSCDIVIPVPPHRHISCVLAIRILKSYGITPCFASLGEYPGIAFMYSFSVMRCCCARACLCPYINYYLIRRPNNLSNDILCHRMPSGNSNALNDYYRPGKCIVRHIFHHHLYAVAKSSREHDRLKVFTAADVSRISGHFHLVHIRWE